MPMKRLTYAADPRIAEISPFPAAPPAAHSPAHLFHQRPGDHVRAGLYRSTAKPRHFAGSGKAASFFPGFILVFRCWECTVQERRRMLVIPETDTKKSASRRATHCSAVCTKTALVLGLQPRHMVGLYKLSCVHKQALSISTRVVTFLSR